VIGQISSAATDPQKYLVLTVKEREIAAMLQLGMYSFLIFKAQLKMQSF
jgi:DNA-binding CsgD family transcriptional regulator